MLRLVVARLAFLLASGSAAVLTPTPQAKRLPPGALVPTPAPSGEPGDDESRNRLGCGDQSRVFRLADGAKVTLVGATLTPPEENENGERDPRASDGCLLLKLLDPAFTGARIPFAVLVFFGRRQRGANEGDP